MNGEFIHEALLELMHIERRYEPYWRYRADALFRERAAALVQWLMNRRRRPEGLALAEERELPGEAEAVESVTEAFAEYMRRKYRNGEFERGGNTKTHGLVRATFEVRDDLPEGMRRGVFQRARSFPAYVRFSGPGPDSPADIDDVGFMSMSVKLMGVEGPRPWDQEQHTQDFLTVSTPTFVTPDVIANAQLHAHLVARTSLFYFFHPRNSHVLDFLMQALWTETQTSPLECQYYSCTPYLLGPGQAMQYSMAPRIWQRSPIPGLPGRPPDHYLRDNMVATLRDREVAFDFLVQVQTDAHSMPIENAGVRWPLAQSPYVKAATIRIPRQEFDTPTVLEFARRLSFSPWHCLEDHRPLGNQNRARRRMYEKLVALRLDRNGTAYYEPDGSERFDAGANGKTRTGGASLHASGGSA